MADGTIRDPDGTPSRGAGDPFVPHEDVAVVVRRHKWTARAFGIAGLANLVLSVSVLMAIFQVLPQHRVQPIVIEFQPKEDQVIRPLPIGDNTPQRIIDRQTRAFAHDYVIVRNEIEPVGRAMVDRWGNDGPIRWMSGDLVYQEFRAYVPRRLELVNESDLRREVEVIAINQISDRQWSVEFRTRDTTSVSPQPVEQNWRALLTVEYNTDPFVWRDRLKNPLGFRVVDYGETRVDEDGGPS